MLDTIALCLIFFVLIMLLYAVIAIHDIPYRIARARRHPHQDAIHAAGWVSAATLHVAWPFLWIWATIYRPERGWGFSQQQQQQDHSQLAALELRISQLEQQLHASTGTESPKSAQQGEE